MRAAGVTGGDLLLGEGPHATIGGVVQGSSAIRAWRALRETLPVIGYWPVLLGNDDSLERLQEVWDGSPREEVEKAASLQVATWLEERAASDPSYYRRVHGSWPFFVRRPSFVIPTLKSDRGSELYLGAVPTARSWEVPAYLMFGGWNECPLPHEQVAMHRYWFDRYGAEIVGVTDDILECAVLRPPRTRDEALALADEQFIYCADIVSQGTETLESLAASLKGGDVWYFWWD